MASSTKTPTLILPEIPDPAVWGGEVFERLIDAAPDAMLVVGQDGTIELVNRQTEALFGWARSELVGRSVDTLVPASARAGHSHRRAAFTAQPSTRVMGASRDLYAVRANGTEVPVDISLSPMRLADGRDVVVVAIRDVTDNRRSADALREANCHLTAAVADLESRSSAMTLLARGSEVLQGCRTIEEALRLISNATPMIFEGLEGALFVHAPDQLEYTPLAQWAGFRGPPIDPESCWAYRTGLPHVFGHDPMALRCAHVAPEIGWSLCIPLVAQNETVALVHLQDGTGSDPDGGYTARQEELGRLLSTQWSLTLANLRLRASLHSESIRDPLTALFNRRYLDEAFPQAISRAARQRTAVGIAMIDLDHFKAFNDTHGHLTGDRVLRDLGRFLLENTRGEDIAARFGGEEFVLILNDLGVDQCVAKVSDLGELWRGRDDTFRTWPTLSIGLALYPDHGSTAADLLSIADAALYQAKAEGRDRFVLGRHDPTVGTS